MVHFVGLDVSVKATSVCSAPFSDNSGLRSGDLALVPALRRGMRRWARLGSPNAPATPRSAQWSVSALRPRTALSQRVSDFTRPCCSDGRSRQSPVVPRRRGLKIKSADKCK